MSCFKIKRDYDIGCATPTRKFAQQVVLVNKSDVYLQGVKNLVSQSGCIGNMSDEACYQHALYFNLLEGKRGFRITVPETSASVFAKFEKSTLNGTPQYRHSIQIPLTGMDEELMCFLKELDNGDYFGAVQFGNQIIILGYDYGLSTNDYSFDPQNSFGGGLITLTSNDDYLEDEPPFIYKSQNGTEIEDFDNNFEDIEFDPSGDFNDDFNNDFF